MVSSLYVHIPFCRQKCDYCDFFSVGEKDRKGKNNDVSASYIDAVINEAKFYADYYDIRQWSSIYFGGGTPGILSEEQLVRLVTGVKKAASVQKSCEITVEVNPENVTEEKLFALESCGVNRISMGVQAFDDKALKAVNRKSSSLVIAKALECLDRHWNGRLSIDFIAGLPCHTWKSFESQFELLKKFPKIDHVSLYTLTVEENTPLWKKIEEGKIYFSQEKADRMWIKGRNILEKMGFFQYEISNFSRPGFESVHNSGYWLQKNYIGVGAGASGTVYDFKNKSALRWTDTLSIPEYVDFFNDVQSHPDVKYFPRQTEELSEETLEFEFLMLGFRKLTGVSASEYEDKFKKNLSERLGEKGGLFEEWTKKRLAKRTSADGDVYYSLTKRGILLLNLFLEELL